MIDPQRRWRPLPDKPDYAGFLSFGGAPIAGFTRGKGLFCIVGTSEDGSLQIAEVKRLLEEHQGEISGV